MLELFLSGWHGCWSGESGGGTGTRGRSQHMRLEHVVDQCRSNEMDTNGELVVSGDENWKQTDNRGCSHGVHDFVLLAFFFFGLIIQNVCPITFQVKISLVHFPSCEMWIQALLKLYQIQKS